MFFYTLLDSGSSCATKFGNTYANQQPNFSDRPGYYRHRKEYGFYEPSRKENFALPIFFPHRSNLKQTGLKKPNSSWLKKSINERSQRRALGQNDDQAQQQHDQKNRPQPPLFANAHERPKLSKDRKLSHDLTPFFVLILLLVLLLAFSAKSDLRATIFANSTVSPCASRTSLGRERVRASVLKHSLCRCRIIRLRLSFHPIASSIFIPLFFQQIFPENFQNQRDGCEHPKI